MRQFRKLAQLLSVTQITSIQRTEILTNNGLSGLSLANSWWTNSKRLFVLSPTGFWSKSEPLSKPTKHRNPQHRTRKWRRPLETEKVEMHTLCWCSGLSQDRIVLIGVGGGGQNKTFWKSVLSVLNIVAAWIPLIKSCPPAISHCTKSQCWSCFSPWRWSVDKCSFAFCAYLSAWKVFAESIAEEQAG